MRQLAVRGLAATHKVIEEKHVKQDEFSCLAYHGQRRIKYFLLAVIPSICISPGNILKKADMADSSFRACKGDPFRQWLVNVINCDYGQDSYDPECHKNKKPASFV